MMDLNTTVQSGFNLSLLPNFLFLLSLFAGMAYMWYKFEVKPYEDNDDTNREP